MCFVSALLLMAFASAPALAQKPPVTPPPAKPVNDAGTYSPKMSEVPAG